MTMTHPTARAEFEALCDSYCETVTAINNGKVGLIRGTVEREQILSKLVHLVFANRAVIAAALPTDTAPAQLPDDWRPRPDADGD